MLAKPYYGITGVTTIEQSQALLRTVDRLGLPRTHQLMIGVLASYKSLARGSLADPKQYVPVNELNDVLVHDRRLLNTVHYNSRADGLVLQLGDLLGRVRYARGVQLNIAWPAPEVLDQWRSEFYIRVILQVGSRAYGEVGRTPVDLAKRLERYAGLVDYVLFDSSGGTGTPFDDGEASRVLCALVATELPMRWGIAGGLNPDNLAAKLQPLREIYPDLSFDAQGGLRDPLTKGLSLDRSRAFLEAVWTLLSR